MAQRHHAPGWFPLWHLAQAVASVTGMPTDEQARFARTLAIRRTLNLGVEALPELTERYGLGQGAPVCLLIDQFEELFTYAREAVREEALTFIEVLRGFADEPPPGVHGVLTMRSDHLGDCGRYLGFAELVNRTQYLLPRMDDASLLRAIREPARLYDGEVTLELALRLVQDSAGEADALPLVQHCLMRLWRRAPWSMCACRALRKSRRRVGKGQTLLRSGRRAPPSPSRHLPVTLRNPQRPDWPRLRRNSPLPQTAAFVFSTCRAIPDCGRASRAMPTRCSPPWPPPTDRWSSGCFAPSPTSIPRAAPSVGRASSRNWWRKLVPTRKR